MQEIIEKLFFDYQQTEEYAKEFNSVPKKAEIQMAQDTFVKPAFEKSFEQGDKLDEVLTTALCAMENFGFVQGFKYAMRMRNECNNFGGENA